MTTRPRPTRQHPGARVVDVAQLAGVSPQTVSRVANGRTNVDPGTRERVLQAMRELGYRPNIAARVLATGRYRTIGVITSTLSSYGTMRTLEAIADVARELGFGIVLIPLSLPSAGDVVGAASALVQQNMDGLVVMVETATLEAAGVDLPAGIPVVATDVHSANSYLTVDSDEVSAIRQAVDHLVGLGHRTVAHLAGPANSYASHLRESAWRAALDAHGLPAPEPFSGDWGVRSGLACGRLLAEQRDVTAVFVANDQMALGVMHALHAAGRRVPADVSVIGFDDMTESVAFQPALTTVRQDFAALGRRAVELLVAGMPGGTPLAHDEPIMARLVIRDSTGPARRL